MSLKPVDQRSPDEKREAIWAAIRELQTFTLNRLFWKVRMERNSIRDYVLGLKNAGYIEDIGVVVENTRQAKQYRLIKDIGLDAPRVRRDGTPVTQGLAREQMWRTMRILKEFTPEELAINASTEACEVKVSDAKKYCQALNKASYLIATQPGRGLHQSRYRFLPSRFTGPKPPQIQRTKHVYDPNLGEVVWSSREVTS